MSDQAHDGARRKFLGTAAAAAALAAAPGVFFWQGVARARGTDGASSEVRWGMLIDTTQCAKGCDACVRACNEEHGITSTGRPTTDAQWIRKLDVRDPATGHAHSLPMMCQHCEQPPCVDVCPTGASFKRADGIVLVDKHICIGCRYCMMACPYHARSFIHEPLQDQLPHAPRGKGTVESCTMCVHRVDEGRVPACKEACQEAGYGAIVFGNLHDPESEIAQRLAKEGGTKVRADLRLNQGVRYRGLT
ncbi:4Fe-4S dicluster domain-containing protein [Ectothiorhodospiraceae bacterium 2226]|nr:4Fe-4S dicluster domain-containing protein [Ectothiorhodospiraceae bacterium 2226]